MTYQYGIPEQYATPSSAAYALPSTQFGGVGEQRILVWAVVLVGLATYVVSYGVAPQPSGMGWGVRFSTLAAVVAALGLLPGQSARTAPIAVLAVMGLLDGLSQFITSGQNASWVTIVIVVLNVLQALTAIAAALLQRGRPGAARRALAPYDAYAYYAQVAQQYYPASDQEFLQPQPGQAQAAAHAEGASHAQAQQSAAEAHALYAEYLNAQQSAASVAAPQAGTPAQAAHVGSGSGIPRTSPTESIRPVDESGTGRSSQYP
jgi:hypothetical protein